MHGRKAAVEMYSNLTLGTLTELMKLAPPDSIVRFDASTGHPGNPHSYRGYYEDLSFEDSSTPITARAFREMLAGCLNHVFVGYKGGCYTMVHATRLWCSEYGDASGMGISGVRFESGEVTILETIYEP